MPMRRSVMMLRRLSAWVIDTAVMFAMWYRRRLMTSDAQQTAMLVPMLKCVAGRGVSSARLRRRRRALTDIAPSGSPVDRVIAPDHGVDELEERLGADPENVHDAADVPCFQVPVEGDAHQNETEQRKRRDDVNLNRPRDRHLGR